MPFGERWDAGAGGDGPRLPTLLYRPAGEPPAAGWPLLLFLHGSGERGDDLEPVRRHGVPRALEDGAALPPMLVLAPQCPAGAWWTEEGPLAALGALLDAAEARLPVDPARRLATGLSMGGYGAWALAFRHPRRFAALVAVCGGGDPARACELAHLPQWAFHGARDEVVPAARSREMIAALEACDAEDARLTIYEDEGHACWTTAYAEEELWAWLMEQRQEES